MAVGVRRRKFMALLAGAAAVAGDVPAVVLAQQVLARAPDELPRVILVSAGDGADPASRTSVVAFEQGLSAAGWSAGVNMRLDYRWLGADDLTKRAAAEVHDRMPVVLNPRISRPGSMKAATHCSGPRQTMCCRPNVVVQNYATPMRTRLSREGLKTSMRARPSRMLQSRPYWASATVSASQRSAPLGSRDF
jgi:hypothetical protein